MVLGPWGVLWPPGTLIGDCDPAAPECTIEGRPMPLCLRRVPHLRAGLSESEEFRVVLRPLKGPVSSIKSSSCVMDHVTVHARGGSMFS